jgi:5-methylcytosine-specific restriction endonuclease McrA
MSERPFWELYRSPLWQKKRLQIMERAGFACEYCGAKEATLNVHHRVYHAGAKPWEYADVALVCLCEPCHEEEHELLHDLRMMITDLDLLNELVEIARGRWAVKHGK